MRMAMRRGASGATAAPMRGRVCMRAQAKTAIEFDDLVEVIRAVDSSDLVEMELKGKKFAMSIKKQEALQAQEPIVVQAPAAAAAPAAAPAPAPAPAAPAPAAPSAAPQAPAPAPSANSGGGKGVEMVAPMAGTLYRKPAPGEPVFVSEGDKVTVGQTICIVEAMKLMNEIEADTAGTLTKFVVEDAKPIVPGDVIAIIEP